LKKTPSVACDDDNEVVVVVVVVVVVAGNGTAGVLEISSVEKRKVVRSRTETQNLPSDSKMK